MNTPLIIHGSHTRLAKRLRLLTKFPRHDYHAASGVDWNRDILLAYPGSVANAPAKYADMVRFFLGNKYDQWQTLKEYFLCPAIEKPPYVVRPLRHEGGEGFEITNTLPPDSKKSTHYWRSLWKRTSEYRVIFIRGQPAIVLLKKVPEGTKQDIPWNAGVSSFVTVHDHDNDRLRHTKFYERAKKFFTDFPFTFCAVDILYNDCSHRVVEVNFSPGVLIPENFNKIVTELLKPYNDRIRITKRITTRTGLQPGSFGGATGVLVR